MKNGLMVALLIFSFVGASISVAAETKYPSDKIVSMKDKPTIKAPAASFAKGGKCGSYQKGSDKPS